MAAERRLLGPHVAVLFGPAKGKYPDGNTVIVCGRDSTLAIDPSLSVRDEPNPVVVDRVLLTHPHEDHVAGLSSVRHGEVLVHCADAEGLRSLDGLMRLYGIPEAEWPSMTAMVQERFHVEPRPDAVAFEHGDEWELGGVTVRAVAAPGHTSGHTVFLIESDSGERVVVTGDIDLTSFGPYYGDASSDLGAFERSLREVRELVADHYVTFHHKGVVDGHDAFVAAVDAYAAVIGQREHSLLALLGAPVTLDALVDIGIVYRPGTRPPLFGDSVERRTIAQHLDRLVSDSAVGTDGHQYWRR